MFRPDIVAEKKQGFLLCAKKKQDIQTHYQNCFGVFRLHLYWRDLKEAVISNAHWGKNPQFLRRKPPKKQKSSQVILTLAVMTAPRGPLCPPIKPVLFSRKEQDMIKVLQTQ